VIEASVPQVYVNPHDGQAKNFAPHCPDLVPNAGKTPVASAMWRG
jgi:hypothetical protein